MREDASCTIDVERARDQHAAYVRALAEAGIEVRTIPADDAFPDCVFVEDPVVVLGERALLARAGALSRRGEAAAVEAALRDRIEIVPMDGPGTLEGGDVLRSGRTLFVGTGRRTDAAGAAFLSREAAREGLSVVAIPLARALHLKSVASLCGEDLLVYDPLLLDPSPFREAGLDCVPVLDNIGANVLALGKNRVLVSAECGRTADLVASRGFDVRSVPGSEFHKGDGRLTCLSARIAHPGEWCC